MFALFFSANTNTTTFEKNMARFFYYESFFRACSKIKSAQWGFSFTKSKIYFLKQLCN